jgi:hypothetical protein
MVPVFIGRGAPVCMKFAMSIELKGLLAALALLFMASSPALADAFYWGCAFKPTTLRAGPVTCHQTVDCHAKSLRCENADKPLFAVQAFADHIAVPDHGQYVVGLSNRGVTPLFWLRDFNGERIDLTPDAEIHFCQMSVTNVRVWFDSSNPNVRFQFEGDLLSRVVVRGCDGRDVSFDVTRAHP